MSKINVNTANFSAFFSSNSNLSVNQIVRKNVITSKAGCNQIIKSLTENRVFFIIPNSYINNTCKALNRTFEQVIEEFSLFNFKYRIHTSSFDYEYYFLDENENVKDSTIIEINLEDYKGNELDNIQHRYYAFCLIRHFYYYQNLLKYYFDVYNDDDDLTMKMIKFSAAYEKSGSNHTLFCSGINDISACPISVINDFVIKRSNSPEKYRVNTSSENLENYSIEKIIEKRINDFYYKDIFNIDTPFVLISSEMSKLLPKEVKSQIVPGYYFTRIGHDNKGYIVYFMLLVNDNISKYLTQRRLSDIPNYNSSTTINLSDTTTVASYSNLKFHKLKGFYNIASDIKDLIHDFNFQLYNEDLEIVNQQSNKYYIDIKSRHPSHNVFRKSIKSNRKVLVRFGSTTPTTKDYDLVINNERAIENSSDKYKMKLLFTTHDVITAEWTDNPQSIIDSENNFPVIAKHIKGSRNSGNYKLDTPKELNNFLSRRNVSNYIFEKFKNYSKEYRVHVSTEGVFLMWRKLRRLDTPQNQRWFFNNQNCNWVGEDHELFDAPRNIEEIKAECLKALNAVGLSIGAADVRVMSNDRKNVLYSIIEINSAPSMAERTSEAYIKEIIKLTK